MEKLQAELQSPEVTDDIIRETTRRAREVPSTSKKRDAAAKELERERKKLQNLVRALEEGEPSTTVLMAIREEIVEKLEGELAALRPMSATRVAVDGCPQPSGMREAFSLSQRSND